MIIEMEKKPMLEEREREREYGNGGGRLKLKCGSDRVGAIFLVAGFGVWGQRRCDRTVDKGLVDLLISIYG